MHPALSVIFFTTLCGAGYGLWFMIGIAAYHAGFALNTTMASRGLGVGFLLVSLGLLASIGHLGRPLRAWRAFSQWRSSWLSREAIAAVLTYLPALALAIGVARFTLAEFRVTGSLLAFGAAATVFSTARIYSSLPTIRAWHNGFVMPVYVVLAVYSGLLWLGVLGWFHAPMVSLFAFAGAMLKLAYWRFISTSGGTPTLESATGLVALGRVRAFEHPHTEENYLTREMGFALARRHTHKLRQIAIVFGFALPALLSISDLLWPGRPLVFALPALISGSLGIFVERWLFFAEARHTVSLYYGAPSA